MKHTYAAIALVAVAMFGMTACGSAAESQPVETRSLELSWADGVSSRGELMKKAEAVVVGTVESTEIAEIAEFGAMTDATIRVNTWAKSMGQKPETIVIRQTGGLADGVLTQVEDDPLLQVGEKGVFFVRYDANTGVYVVLGGPSGRFKVDKDEAVPMPGSSIRDSKKEKVTDLIRTD